MIKEKLETDFKRDMSAFCLNFRPFEEFYDLSKSEQLARSKKTVTFEDNTPTNKKLKANESTAAFFRDNMSPLPDRRENSPSPMKVPTQENKFKYDYSSMVTKMPSLSNNVSQADVRTYNDEGDKENLTEVELVRPVEVGEVKEDKKALQGAIPGQRHRV